MARMSDAEWRQFLMEGTRTAKAATVRADGSPHVTPVWFVLDGDVLIFTTDTDSVKGKTLRRNPRISLFVDDDTPPYAYVMIDGTVTLSEDRNELVRWATAIGARYLGADRAEEFGRRNGVPGEIVVRVTPTRIVAEKKIAGYD